MQAWLVSPVVFLVKTLNNKLCLPRQNSRLEDRALTDYHLIQGLETFLDLWPHATYKTELFSEIKINNVDTALNR